MKKYEFSQQDIKFLGVNWQAPRNVKDFRSFIGLAIYYRKFIVGYSKREETVTNLLKKDTKWVWSERCQEAFQKLKEAIANEPMLKLPDFKLLFEVHCVASTKDIGGMLVEEGHHVQKIVVIVHLRTDNVENTFYAFSQKVVSIVYYILKLDIGFFYRIKLYQDGTMRQYWIEDDLLHFKRERIVVPNQSGL
uniref:Reverse transcriptase/retrotransposon-derived protein RNase H-like domain-containing protein n=1 Tax=Solanum lycopersicum TaxID=4081 RepID=A0A3Q7J5Y6_SOLLC